MAYTLWNDFLHFNPHNPKWVNRDRFVLSNGHACALQYVLLHLTGFDLTLEDLKSFRQLGSRTPGHPENGVTAGIEVSTGPLGQGLSNAVGLAIAESHLAATFNRPGFPVVDHYTYVICGDGCMQEGITSEAASLAGHLKLGKLIVLYDDNHVTIDGDTELSFTEDVTARFAAYGWHVSSVADGDGVGGVVELHAAIAAAKAVTDRPSLIKVTTTIGFGSVNQGTEKVHGSPLGAADLANLKRRFGFDPEASFLVPDDVSAHFNGFPARGAVAEAEWGGVFGAYEEAFPELAAEFKRRVAGELPADWAARLPHYAAGSKPEATRISSYAVLNALAPAIPELVGGAADLTPSTKTDLKCSHDYQASTPEGRYIRFGVREHAMAAICNGIAAHGGLIPYASTFLNFIGYAIGAVRLSALSHFRVLYVMTHDSIGVGEDGPTHQPIETLASIRSIPNILLFRPADGNETAGAYAAALRAGHRPSVLALSRQDLPQLEGSSVEGVARGAYALPDVGDAAHPVGLVVVASGSEVATAVAAARLVAAAQPIRVRVVSFPCWELFEEQPEEYKHSVFLAGVPTLSVEAAAAMGWERYSHAHVSMRSFGASAPLKNLLVKFGFTPEAVADKGFKLLDAFSSRPLPELPIFYPAF